MAFMMPTMMLVMNLTSVAIVWFGAQGVAAGTMQTGDLIAFITYAMVIIMGCLIMGMVSIMLPRADVAAQRLSEVLANRAHRPRSRGADSRAIRCRSGRAHHFRRRLLPLHRRRRSGALPCVVHGRARHHAGHRRPHRFGQIHHREAHRALLRPDGGLRHPRRRRSARAFPGRPAGVLRLCAPEGLPVRGHGGKQHRLRRRERRRGGHPRRP